jgi:hypothetical protein
MFGCCIFVVLYILLTDNYFVMANVKRGVSKGLHIRVASEVSMDLHLLYAYRRSRGVERGYSFNEFLAGILMEHLSRHEVEVRNLKDFLNERINGERVVVIEGAEG